MIIFENVRVINFEPPSVSEPMDVAVQQAEDSADRRARIIETGRSLSAKYPGARRVNGQSGQACGYLSPGLVCAHTHIYSELSRGLLVSLEPSKDFCDQLKHLWWRLDLAIDLPILEASALAATAEAALCGVTSLVDHHAGPNAIDGSLSVIARAYEETGIRGILCYETTERNRGASEAREGIAENVRFAKEVDAARADFAAGRRNRLPLVDGAIGGHAGFTLGPETLAALGEAAHSTGRGTHIHAGEDKFDAVDSRYRYNKDLAVRLDEAGCLGPKSIVGHGVWLTPPEIELISERDAFLAHNARSNMNNAVGYNNLLHTNKNVIIGTDGMNGDMLEEFKFACFRQREAGGPWWPGDFLKCLDRGNRLIERYFSGSSEVKAFGRVEAGAAADLVLWDYDPPTPLKGENLAGHLAFGLSSRSVRSVMVDGDFVVEEHKPAFDAEAVNAKARTQAQRLWDRMNGK